MDCKIIKVEQGSDEWLALRRSRITASRLADVMADPKTKRYQQYRREKVLELLGNTKHRDKIRKAAYDFGRSMVWSRVGEQYVEEFKIACRGFAERPPADVRDRKMLMRMSLPDRRLDHLFVMTDGTGILQHACYSTPDRNHGYCTDDNARALIVGAMAWSLFQDEEILPHLAT